MIVYLAMEEPEPRTRRAPEGRTVRILRALRACGQVLARAKDEQEMLVRVCEVVVQEGGYRMAWIGWVEHDEPKTVRPVAVAGYEAGYLETVEVTWAADSERGRGPVGTACRAGEVVIVRDAGHDPAFEPWSLNAARRGYRSVIALPVVVHGQRVGALAIYAAEPDAFDEEEALFLRELADDLGYGIAALRDRAERERVERVLADSERQLRAVFDQAPIGMALVSLDGRLMRANAALAAMLDYSVGELVGKTAFELTVPSDLPSEAERNEVIGGGKSLLEREQRLLRRDGTPIWVHTRAFVLRDSAGRATDVMVHFRDIAEHKRAQQALRESESRFQTLLETASDPIFVTDLDGRYIMVNRAAVEGVGAPPERLIGTAGEGVLPPRVIEEQTSLIRKAAETGSVVEVVAQLPGPGGPRWYSSRLSPVMDASGEPAMVLGIARDITAQKNAEAALRSSNEMLTSIVNASPLAIVAVDADSNVMFWKGAAPQLFGWTEDEVLGRRLPIVPEVDRASAAAMIAEVFRGGHSSNVELVRLRKDGRTVSVSLSTAPLRGSDGQIIGVLGMLADLSESKLMEAQLQHAVKMEAVGRLAGGVAHDFNNLIMIVIANAGLMLSELPGDHPMRPNLEEIRASAERTAALTKQLLAFSRRQVMQPRTVNLNAVVTDIERLLRRVMGEDIELRLRLEPALGATFADPDQMSQVLMNLAVNARDAMPRGGTLTLETKNTDVDAAHAAHFVDARPGAYVKLTVTDTGVGMTPELREHIFEPFFTTKERGRGTGLGLSTVYGIVRQSSGHIVVYSEPGRGSTFSVYLPRSDHPAETPASRQPATPRGQGQLILLVEDEPAVRSVVQRALERHGYRVMVASSAPEGLRRCEGLKDERLPLVITDLVMPGMSGDEMAAEIRRHRPETRVLFMSGYAERSIAEQGVAALNAGYLQKPFSLETLLTKVREVLAQGL